MLALYYYSDSAPGFSGPNRRWKKKGNDIELPVHEKPNNCSRQIQATA
jgi:hypothetical protein